MESEYDAKLEKNLYRNLVYENTRERFEDRQDVEWVDPHSLTPHPISVRNYGETTPDMCRDIAESILEVLFLINPLVRDEDDRVLCGNRRLVTLRDIFEWELVPCQRERIGDDRKLLLTLILGDNINRIKTRRQIYWEIKSIREIHRLSTPVDTTPLGFRPIGRKFTPPLSHEYVRQTEIVYDSLDENAEQINKYESGDKDWSWKKLFKYISIRSTLKGTMDEMEKIHVKYKDQMKDIGLKVISKKGHWDVGPPSTTERREIRYIKSMVFLEIGDQLKLSYELIPIQDYKHVLKLLDNNYAFLWEIVYQDDCPFFVVMIPQLTEEQKQIIEESTEKAREELEHLQTIGKIRTDN